MAKYLTDELELQSLADAIRAKGGTSESLAFPSGFVSAIEGIETGGGSEDHSVEDAFITRTISGSYYNSRVTEIGKYAFNYCTSLTTINFPACTNIESNAFYNCSSLTTVSFPACMIIGGNAFYNCSRLTVVNFPACTSIKNNAFTGCTSLTTINSPACTNIEKSAFYDCSSLTTISFPVCTNIGSNAFQYCRNLLSAYFMGSSIPSLANSNIFNYTPIGGYIVNTGVYGSIYVPASMLESYKTATNWSYFSDKFVGVE